MKELREKPLEIPRVLGWGEGVVKTCLANERAQYEGHDVRSYVYLLKKAWRPECLEQHE